MDCTLSWTWNSCKRMKRKSCQKRNKRWLGTYSGELFYGRKCNQFDLMHLQLISKRKTNELQICTWAADSTSRKLHLMKNQHAETQFPLLLKSILKPHLHAQETGWLRENVQISPICWHFEVRAQKWVAAPSVENVHGKVVGRSAARHQKSDAEHHIFVNIIWHLLISDFLWRPRCTGIYRVCLSLKVVVVNQFL